MTQTGGEETEFRLQADAAPATQPPLVIVGSDQLRPAEIGRIQELARAGARVVAWQHPAIAQERFPSPDVAAALARRGISAVPLAEALGDSLSAQVDDAVIAWMKEFGRKQLVAEGSFRRLFTFERLSLWWWAEFYLYHDTLLRLLLRDVEALSRLLEKERPAQLFVVAPVRELDGLARELADAAIISSRRGPRPSRLRTTLRFWGNVVKLLAGGLKTALRRPPLPPPGPCRFLFLSHAAMWRQRLDRESGRLERFETYFDPILPALAARGEAVRSVAVGPAVPFKRRSFTALLREVFEIEERNRAYVPLKAYAPAGMTFAHLKAHLLCWRQWRRFSRLTGVDAALTVRGLPLGAEAREAFRATFLLLLPWAIRTYREIQKMLQRERPDLLVLYAEYTTLGRAALAAAHALGVKTFAIQHGIIYPRLYGLEHAAHEVGPQADGGEWVPLPTRTAVFGSLARDLLVSRGHYPEERIVVTGSPKFDALVQAGRRCSVPEIRNRLGLEPAAPVLVVASRFSALGPSFRQLLRAAASLPSLWLLVKPHQAESPSPYLEAIAGERARRVKVLSPEEPLLELMVASDGLITVDSFASSEALVLDRPVLVLNMPSNLSPLVERGVALGVRRGGDIAEALERLIFDRTLARELAERRRDYRREFAFGADGHSTERVLAALCDTARLQDSAPKKADEARDRHIRFA